jgi:hypothetical protein
MSASRRVARGWRAAALATLLAAGCVGPVGYVSQVTRNASAAVDEARAVNAAKYAPYWWTRATEYLHQARVEAAASDWQAANRFGWLATRAAEQAKADAIRRAADPKLMDEITPPAGAGGTGRLAPALGDDAAGDAPPKLAPATGDDGDAP